MTDYMDHLFSYVPSSRLDTFSYGHVIPSENLIMHTLAKGVHGSDLDFSYESRDSEKMVGNTTRNDAFSLSQTHADHRPRANNSDIMPGHPRRSCGLLSQLRLP